MKAVSEMPREVSSRIEAIFTDIDDTMTVQSLIPAETYQAVWAAREAGIKVVPVTGRPAGWCDHIARMWPVSAVVGENGALAFAVQETVMRRIYAPRQADEKELLERIRLECLEQVPGCKVAADQPYREYDLAIDFAEEVPHLSEESIDKIVAIFERYGAQAKVSSIHVNGYFGDFDKLSMCKRCCEELLGAPLDTDRSTFVGDSPNDVPMFRFFPHAVGVANVRDLAHRMDHLPAYITEARGGFGFAELVNLLLENR